jgi:hypothetical protein
MIKAICFKISGYGRERFSHFIHDTGIIAVIDKDAELAKVCVVANYFDCEAIKEPARLPEGPGNKKAYVIPGQRLGHNANLVGSTHKIGPRQNRHKRSVWSITVKAFKGAHFTTFPRDLVVPCIQAGCPVGGTVLDPFGGAGTVALAANQHGRDALLIELSSEYAAIAEQRLKGASGLSLLDRVS